MFILDTDHLGILQRENGSEFVNLRGRLRQYDESQFYVTIISFQEQINGWNAYVARSKNEDGAVHGYLKLEHLLADFDRSQLLPYGSAAADVFSDIRSQRVRIGTMDLRIGAIAIANGMTVLTRNTVDFDQIPNLTVEDWTTNPE